VGGSNTSVADVYGVANVRLLTNGGTVTIGGVIPTVTENVNVEANTAVGINGDTVNITGGYLNATMGGGINLSTSGTVNVTADDPISISTTGGTDTINITSASDLGLSGQQSVNITATDNDINLTTSAGAVTVNSGSISMTTTTGNISLHSNGAGTMTIASSADAVIISSAPDNLVQLTSGTGGVFLNTGGDLYLNGGSIQDTAFGTPAGQYLRIKLNGTYYKIQLLDDV
jgi:uncharacterized protein (DUF2345 family)